ncbi:MAG TPA: SLC13 family permease [Kiritimatiellia bacterium]|nr:SLC13 family permease [Kiritimatiellia bacterium]
MKPGKRVTGMTSIKWMGLLLSIFVFFIPFIFQFEELSVAGHRVLAIFLMAIVLWVTEAIPLHATASLIIFLNILLVSDKAMMALPEDFKAPTYSSFFYALANPVLMLFLGGFFLADGAAKYKLDKNLAKTLLKPFGTKPSNIILGLMLIVAVFSMFMSNTATTAAFMAVVLPVIARLSPSDRGRIALVLCIPIAANVGGMGTPVGTPPNAIALGALNKAGIHISFLEWMMMIVPFMLILLVFCWQMLVRLFPTKAETITIEIDSAYDRSPKAIIFYVTAAVTILLWFTEPLHGIQSAIVGFLPVVVMLSTKLITDKEFHSMQWSVLWLVAGGIALGDGVGKTGLDKWLIGLVDWEHMAPGMIAGALCVAALLFSTIISNSATANLLVPIGISLTASPDIAISPITSAIFIAIGSSLAMSLPISTPPNAIAYSTGQIQTKQMALTGVFIGLVGMLLFIYAAPLIWNIFGIMPD